MKLQFKYKCNTYVIDVEEKHLWTTSEDRKISLMVRVKDDIVNVQYSLDEHDIPCLVGQVLIHDATLIDEEEVAFQRLLTQYKLTDNKQTRKLWYKCYGLGRAYGLSEQVDHWHDLVELLID